MVASFSNITLDALSPLILDLRGLELTTQYWVNQARNVSVDTKVLADLKSKVDVAVCAMLLLHRLSQHPNGYSQKEFNEAAVIQHIYAYRLYCSHIIQHVFLKMAVDVTVKELKSTSCKDVQSLIVQNVNSIYQNLISNMPRPFQRPEETYLYCLQLWNGVENIQTKIRALNRV
jgi:hypothetical protein